MVKRKKTTKKRPKPNSFLSLTRSRRPRSSGIFLLPPQIQPSDFLFPHKKTITETLPSPAQKKIKAFPFLWLWRQKPEKPPKPRNPKPFLLLETGQTEPPAGISSPESPFSLKLSDPHQSSSSSSQNPKLLPLTAGHFCFPFHLPPLHHHLQRRSETSRQVQLSPVPDRDQGQPPTSPSPIC